MSAINMVLGLTDKISPVLTKAEKQAVANVKAFQNLDKETKNLNQAWDELAQKGMQNTKIADDLMGAIVSNENAMKEYANGTRNAAVAEEEASNSAGKLQGSMTELNQTLGVVEKGWQLIKQAVQQAYEWMDKYNTQFNAEFTAGIKMHNILGATEEEIKSMYDYAAALQKVGVVGDETIIAGMAELSTYARTTAQVRKLIPQVLNLAVGNKGLEVSTSDVTSAASLLGQALNGQATRLKRQIGLTDAEVQAIDALNDRTEKAELLTQLLAERTGNANEILGETASGGILQVRNALGDLEEQLGEKITPYIAELERAFYTIIQPIVNWLVDNLDTIIPILIGVAGAVGVLAAAIAIINLAPLIMIVGIIGMVISAILAWVKAQDKATGQVHSSLGMITGMFSTFMAFIYDSVIVPIYNAIASIGNLLANFAKDPIASVKMLFLDLATTIMSIAREIAGVLDLLFGTNMQGTVDSWIGALNQTKEEVKAASGWEEVIKPLENWDMKQAAQQGYEFGDKMSESISKAIDDNNFFNKFGDAIGLDENGDTALKTTSSDNLLGEEDVQLLLDIATRDFKVDYQQITPQISIEFGDVHETADVDGIYEEIVTQMEEVFESDLMEVATA